MLELISQPWPWYVAGPMISFIMFGMIWTGKNFGVSSTMRTVCAASGAGKYIPFFNFNWKSQLWNIIFIIGAVIGGFLASSFLDGDSAVNVSGDTVRELTALGLSAPDGHLLPPELFNWGSLTTVSGFIVLVVGGFLVGFGARWAGGCTSGHAISGLSNLQLPSLIAVVGFFIGGLLMTHLFLPIILRL